MRGGLMLPVTPFLKKNLKLIEKLKIYKPDCSGAGCSRPSEQPAPERETVLGYTIRELC